MIINGIELKPGQFYKPDEAGQALGWTAATLAAYRCRAGGIPFTTIGRKVLYRGSDLIEFIEQSHVATPGADPLRSAAARERAERRRAREAHSAAN